MFRPWLQQVPTWDLPSIGRSPTQVTAALRMDADAENENDMELWTRRIRSLPVTVRSVALEQLLRIDQEGAYAGLVGGSPVVGSQVSKGSIDALDRNLPESPNSAKLEQRERRRITEIVSGVIRWQRRLHWTLSNLPKPTKVDTMDPPLRILLYMATYELLELKLASHAINEYVTLARDVMHDGCAKVANGVLRAVIRLKDSGTLPVPPKPEKGMKFNDVADLLAINFSHPTWMVARWLKRFGLRRTIEILKINNSRPKYSVRVSPGQDVEDLITSLEDMGAVVNRSHYLPNEYLVISSGLQSIINSGLLKEGKLQVQDEAAGMVVAMLSPRKGDSLLDCCAAPGGKTLFAAARMSGKGSIVALDSVDSRLGALRKAAQQQSFGDMITCIAADARQFCENAALSNDTFDRVLVDAPCSGTGVLCKRADMRWRRKVSDMTGLVTLQMELLDAASMVVCPEGLLVYSTCSIEPEENELVVERFLKDHPEFYLEEANVVPDIPKECMSASGMLQMYPDVHRTDGAFAARMRRG